MGINAIYPYIVRFRRLGEFQMNEEVCEHVYEPAEDTFLLLEAALSEVKENDSVLELGTGSGIIAKTLSKKSKISRIVTTDINPYAVRCARSKGLKVIRTNFFDGLESKFDLILFNPPYLPIDHPEIGDRWLEISWDGGKDGRRAITEFLKGVGDYLSGKGRFLLVVSSLSGIEETINFARNKGFVVEIPREKKLFFERLVVVRGALD